MMSAVLGRWLVSASLVASVASVASCRSAAPVAGSATSGAKAAATAGPSVWSVDLVTVLPGERGRYERFLEANWARARRTARAKGEIRSYHALFTADTTVSGWQVILLTEYPDSAAYGRREEIFQPILTAQGRTLIDGKGPREMTAPLDGRWLLGLLGEP